MLVKSFCLATSIWKARLVYSSPGKPDNARKSRETSQGWSANPEIPYHTRDLEKLGIKKNEGLFYHAFNPLEKA